MKYLLLLIALIIIYSCAFDSDKDSKASEEKNLSWLSVSEWRATTFDQYWYPTSDNQFSTSSPVQCTTIASQYRDKHFAFDIFGLNERTLGDFDSISFTYQSNIDLGIVSAIRWHDELGDDDHLFELKQEEKAQFLPMCTDINKVTFARSDFGADIGDSAHVQGQSHVTIDMCNNFGIWGTDTLKQNDTIIVQLVDIEIHR